MRSAAARSGCVGRVGRGHVQYDDTRQTLIDSRPRRLLLSVSPRQVCSCRAVDSRTAASIAASRAPRAVFRAPTIRSLSSFRLHRPLLLHTSAPLSTSLTVRAQVNRGPSCNRLGLTVSPWWRITRAARAPLRWVAVCSYDRRPPLARTRSIHQPAHRRARVCVQRCALRPAPCVPAFLVAWHLRKQHTHTPPCMCIPIHTHTAPHLRAYIPQGEFFQTLPFKATHPFCGPQPISEKCALFAHSALGMLANTADCLHGPVVKPAVTVAHCIGLARTCNAQISRPSRPISSLPRPR